MRTGTGTVDDPVVDIPAKTKKIKTEKIEEYEDDNTGIPILCPHCNELYFVEKSIKYCKFCRKNMWKK